MLVPILMKKTPTSDKEDIQRAITCHSVAQSTLSHSYSQKIITMDSTLPQLNNATLHSTILALKTNRGNKLFLSVDPNWGGNGYTFVFPQKYASQANDYVEFLPKYLLQFHGDEVFCWLTPEAITEACKMGWDDEKQ